MQEFMILVMPKLPCIHAYLLQGPSGTAVRFTHTVADYDPTMRPSHACLFLFTKQLKMKYSVTLIFPAKNYFVHA